MWKRKYCIKFVWVEKKSENIVPNIGCNCLLDKLLYCLLFGTIPNAIYCIGNCLNKIWNTIYCSAKSVTTERLFNQTGLIYDETFDRKNPLKACKTCENMDKWLLLNL